MNKLKKYVNWKLTHADKTAESEGYPLVLENCKSNKRMKYLEIYGNSFQDGTPTPDNPIEVESVGVKSVNLFDVNTVTVIKSYNAKNIIATDSGFSFIANGTYGNATFKIGLPIDYIGKTLTLSSPSYYNTSATQLLLFDGTTVHRTGSNYVSNNNGLYSTTITINESDCIDGYFLCIRLYFTGQTTGNIIEYKNIMLAEGSTTTPYEPYGKYKIPIVQRGVNLFSMAKTNLVEKTVNGITFTPLDDERVHIKGKVIDTSITTIYNPTFGNRNQTIKAGTYRLKRYSSELTQMISVYNNGNWVVNINAQHNSVSVSKDGYLSGVYISISAGNTREWDDIIEIQLVKGTSNPPYEPYVEPTSTNIFLNEPLRKIGDYADYVDFKNKKVVRNTFVRVYDGYGKTDNPFSKGDNEDNWAGNENHGDVHENLWLFTLNDTLPIIPKNGHHSANDYKQIPICLQLPTKTGYYDSTTSDATVDKELIWFNQQGRGVRLYLSKDRVGGTRSNILTYLRANPISVVIATYQPYEEPITCELPKLNAKTTIIEVDTSLEASNAYGKYIKR